MNTTILQNVNEYFKLPINYNKEKMELKENIVSDLELVNTVDNSNNSIYSFCFEKKNIISEKIVEQISKFYTTDVAYLKDNQQLLKDYKNNENNYTNYSPNYEKIIAIWNELKIETGFKEKYYYIDWEILDFLNSSEIFLQFISIYNLFSPIFSLMIPIIILIVPFFILKIKGLKVTIPEYVNILKLVAQTNAIGKLFVINLFELSLQEQLYIFISAALYIFSIYQNVMVCVRFNNNMKNIHEYFKEIEIYNDFTIKRINNYLQYAENLNSFHDFHIELKNNLTILNTIKNKIKSISDYKLFNIKKMKEIGKILKYFYEFHNNTEYNSCIMYSLGFNGYLDCIEGLQENINNKKIHYAEFSNDIKKNSMKKSYYACLKNKKPIKNTILLNKNKIITGPNASGKTTILKSTLINIILSQQFGCGFYDSANLTPYHFIHCYLNIPDTSGRDSLFQAEARRCKEILDIIHENKDKNHFCVFDELYSGTNPEEAEISATEFMKYLQKFSNVSCILTTHFIKICKKLQNMETIENYKMLSLYKNYKMKYYYILKEGISKIKGGIQILADMNYPKEIIENTQKSI